MNVLASYLVPHPPIIIPAVGKGEERKLASTTAAYEKVAKDIEELNPDTIVIVSPHSMLYGDYFHISPGKRAEGSFEKFGVPEESFQIEYDEEFSNHLTTLAEKNQVRAGFLGEQDPSFDHGVMVPLYFLMKQFRENVTSPIVRIGLSGLSFEEHYKLGQLIQKTAKELDKNIVFIASGDLSHRLTKEGPYGYKKEGPIYDKKIMEMVSEADFLGLLTMQEEFCERAGECGHRSLCMMAGVFDGIEVKSKQLSYEGPFGVGYGIASFHPVGEKEERRLLEKAISIREKQIHLHREKEDRYVRLAREAVEEYIRNGKIIDVPSGLPEELSNKRAGVFVSLKIAGHLRGCIGTIEPTRDSIAKEIIENAISAATNDPRFDEVEEDELKSLVYSVDVLGEAEEIDSKELLDEKRYGVIVKSQNKLGLLLPNLDGIDSVDEQIAIAMQKAGIREGDPIILHRFEVIRHF
ncbi:extradiol ring-cleavage dioxygenase [Lachnospiraceae bacterium KM106-2]|nr:extradiol ring-cleavage dioxygenase [Lachnospiraceae bacterium KM106-2]